MHRIHSLDDVLNKDKDFIINYFATTKTQKTTNNIKESSSTTDEGFHSNDNNQSNETNSKEKCHNNNNNKKKLLFSSHAQYSRDFSLDDGVEESIVLSEIEPSTVCELLNDAEDNISDSTFQIPSVKNEVYVKICGSSSGSNIVASKSLDDDDKNG